MDTTQPAATREELFHQVDELLRKVLVPAYERIVAPFTLRERNDFYLAPENWHGLERVGWGATGIVLGAFVVWAPFIPIWSKEWVLVFAVGGLVFPTLRRFLALRRYEGDLNRLVARADDEIWRMSLAALTRGTLLSSAAAPDALDEAGDGEAERTRPAVVPPASAPERPSAERPTPPKAKLGQGGR
jgi:hypothetical protein